MVCFRFRGRSYKKSIKTKYRSEAEIILGGVTRTLFRVEQILLELPAGVDIITIALADRKRVELPAAPKVPNGRSEVQGFLPRTPAWPRGSRGILGRWMSFQRK
jgi:hypothetical protein